jgi:hypothetical protein
MNSTIRQAGKGTRLDNDKAITFDQGFPSCADCTHTNVSATAISGGGVNGTSSIGRC